MSTNHDTNTQQNTGERLKVSAIIISANLRDIQHIPQNLKKQGKKRMILCI